MTSSKMQMAKRRSSGARVVSVSSGWIWGISCCNTGRNPALNFFKNAVMHSAIWSNKSVSASFSSCSASSSSCKVVGQFRV